MRLRTTRVTGINKVRQRLGSAAAERLEEALETDVGVETRKMATNAAKAAPVETGALKISILSSTRRAGKLTWYFGSWLPYALRQEYEHKTKHHYFRNAYFGGMKPAEREFKKTIKRVTGG